MKNAFVASTTLAATLALALVSRNADACSAPPCFGSKAYVLPANGGTVPANAAALPVFAPALPFPLTVTLEKVEAGGSTPVTIERGTDAARPDVLLPSGLEAGASYKLTVAVADRDPESACGSTSVTTFTAGPSAPKPTTLGALKIKANGLTKLGLAASGRCSAVVEVARAELEIEPSTEAAPWAGLLRYETYVDGKKWFASNDAGMQVHRAGSWVGIGKDVVYAACETIPETFAGVSQGRHSVVMKAFLAGDPSLVLESAPATIELTCPPSGDAGAGGPDGGGVDAGAADDGGGPAGPNANPAGVSGGGCSSTGPSGAAAGAPGALMAFVAVAVARARRRRRA